MALVYICNCGFYLIQRGIYLTELGEKVDLKRGSMFVSTDNGGQWSPLQVLAEVININKTIKSYYDFIIMIKYIENL